MTEVYDNVKSMQVVNDKVTLIRNRDGSDGWEDTAWKQADSRFPPKDDETLIAFIKRLCRHIIEVECSNRCYQSALDHFERK